MENSHKYFCNHSCKYHPCHTVPDGTDFNCLFCYCPLYFLGDTCGGIFTYRELKDGIVKVCMDCHLPHLPEYYDTVLQKLKEAKAPVRVK